MGNWVRKVIERDAYEEGMYRGFEAGKQAKSVALRSIIETGQLEI
jgi:hypothetical protein